MSGFWRNSEGQLRSGWRVGLWLMATIVGLVLVSLPSTIRGESLDPTGVIAALVALVAAWLISLGAWRWMDRTPAAGTPLATGDGASRALLGGFLLGALLIALVVVALSVGGWYRLEAQACDLGDQGTFWLKYLGLFLFAGALEEVLFRGYPLFTLRESLGRTPAIVLLGALFALAHAGNPNVGWMALLNIAFIGIVLGDWVFRSGTLWGVIGVHAGWNWALAAGAAIPVSGQSFVVPCYSGALSGPVWLTGGEFGIEAGVAALAVWALAAIVIARRSPGVESEIGRPLGAGDQPEDPSIDIERP